MYINIYNFHEIQQFYSWESISRIQNIYSQEYICEHMFIINNNFAMLRFKNNSRGPEQMSRLCNPTELCYSSLKSDESLILHQFV